MDISLLLVQVLALAGLAAFIAMLVNVGKTVGIVKDGDAPAWVAGLQLGALSIFFVAHFVAPNLDLLKFDAQLGALAIVGIKLLEFVVGLGLTKFIHDKALAGTPLVGKSFTNDEFKRMIDEDFEEEEIIKKSP